MNRHELVDVGTVGLAALLLGDAKFFARGVDAPPLVDVAAGAEVDAVGDIARAGQHDVTVETPVGDFEAAYLPWQWRGPEYPTLVYHHGSGEDPFDLGRLASSSFRRLFVANPREIPANVVAVRAPFHDGSNAAYARAMGEMENFVGMLAASVGLLEALVARTDERTDGPVVLAGISLGGWAVNLHRARFGTADGYAPVFAGAALGETFVSSTYRWVTGRAARNRPERVREILNFERAFTAVDADDCRPLLARYDRIVELERQRLSYEGLPLSVIEKGHTTGSLATRLLRGHVLSAVRSSTDGDPPLKA